MRVLHGVGKCIIHTCQQHKKNGTGKKNFFCVWKKHVGLLFIVSSDWIGKEEGTTPTTTTATCIAQEHHLILPKRRKNLFQIYIDLETQDLQLNNSVQFNVLSLRIDFEQASKRFVGEREGVCDSPSLCYFTAMWGVQKGYSEVAHTNNEGNLYNIKSRSKLNPSIFF
jgi:hypothetical protein